MNLVQAEAPLAAPRTLEAAPSALPADGTATALAGTSVVPEIVPLIDRFVDGEAGPDPVFSIVMITYCRDDCLAELVPHLAPSLAGRDDVEFILIDNNPDLQDRSALLRPLGRVRYVKLGRNRGTPARNDGLRRARGRFIAFMDDDAFIRPPDFLDRFKACFDADPALGIVGGRPRNYYTGITNRAYFPHTDKSRDPATSFKTWRFIGDGFMMRREVYERVGGMSEELFYGLEELDYAYRVVKAGFEMYYLADVEIREMTHPGGRQPHRRVEEIRLRNKYIISYKYLPWSYLMVNLPLFTVYRLLCNRGQLNVFNAIAGFYRWLKTPGRTRRDPIGPDEIAYIRRCGGQAWR